jgi:5-methylcytosine-specific restriction endonuclease McrA
VLRPVKWNEWLALGIRSGDKSLKSTKGLVRVPTVVGKFSYNKMPRRKPKLDNQGIAARDHHVCQVTGKHAPDGNVDHLVPRSRGGKTKAWTNMVWMQRELNSKKGDKTLEEMGWKLIRKPVQPLELPSCVFIKPKHPDWLLFLPGHR